MQAPMNLPPGRKDYPLLLHNMSFSPDNSCTIRTHDGPVFVTMPLAEHLGQVFKVTNHPESLQLLYVRTDLGEVELKVGQSRVFTTSMSRTNRLLGRLFGQKTKLLWGPA